MSAAPGCIRAQQTSHPLLDAGDAITTEVAARHVREPVPHSPALYLAASQALQREGKEYEARSVLEEGVSALERRGEPSTELLARLAMVEDAHGEGAADLYRKLAERAELPKERLAALERGFEVALRDGDTAQARRLAELLDTAGHPEYAAVSRKATSFAGQTMIPGGRDGLSLMAMARTGISGQRFLADFSRALLANVCSGICFGVDEYRKMVEDYFGTVAQLEGLGERDHERVSISLARGNEEDNRRTEKVLGLLGVELRTDNGTIRLEQGVKRRQARKQDMVAALAIDLIGIQKALNTGKAYTLEILDEPVEVYPNASVWEDAFPGLAQENFAALLLRHPKMARLYASITEIDGHTLEVLFGAEHPADLATRYAAELARFGPAFAVSGDRAVVPGGQRAEAVWKELAEVSPEQPGAFFRALLANPPLLAYFYSVSELDAGHQAFFTANPQRAQRFYTLSKDLTGEGYYHKDLSIDSTFWRFLRTVPLDADGHVQFPGSAAVWMVAKGSHADQRHISNLERRASGSVAPGLEDDILSHLAETSYDAQGLRDTELDNFLAVSRLNAHLKQPMNEESALLLAQHYSECWPFYVYFSDLPGVNDIGLPNFFALLDHVRQKPRLIQNVEMGQLYSLLGWVSILRRNQVLDGKEAEGLFAQSGESIERAAGQGDMAVASLKIAESIVNACGESADANPDEAVRDCMLRGWGRDENRRAEDFGRVLAMQNAPKITDVKSIAEAAQRIATGPEAAGHKQRDDGAAALRADAQIIADAAARLPSVEIPRTRRVSSRERESIEIYSPALIREQARALNDIAQSAKPDFKAARKLARQLSGAIGPQVTAALAGPIYAYYLRSTDLIVSEDRLLLRKHRYVDYLTPLGGKHVVDRADFFPSSDGAGSHFVGGFGDFALVAGRAAAAGFHQGGQGASAMIAAQLAAIRSVPWERLKEEDQRLAVLRILAGREWIVRSATDPAYFEALTNATVGVLSLSRRADLLSRISDRDWDMIWNSVPLPDLYTLGTEMARYSLPGADSSPVLVELRDLESAGNGRNVDYLGHIPYLADGCGHLHMAVDAPYEEYARRLMQEDLAERTADFKLYLAYRADNAGIEPSELGRVAEKLAARAFAASQLTDYHDWRSLFAAYNSITTHNLKKALEP